MNSLGIDGEEIRYRWLTGPHGPFIMIASGNRLVATGWRILGAKAPPAACEDSGLLDELAVRINRSLRGVPGDFDDVPLLEEATPFRQACWRQARTIGGGNTKSYGQLAIEVERPGGARAVGQAMRNNPLPIIVPCHRIIGSNGRMGGFSGSGQPEDPGVLIKQDLVSWEAAWKK